jgi:hypothetical protein
VTTKAGIGIARIILGKGRLPHASQEKAHNQAPYPVPPHIALSWLGS